MPHPLGIYIISNAAKSKTIFYCTFFAEKYKTAGHEKNISITMYMERTKDNFGGGKNPTQKILSILL